MKRGSTFVTLDLFETAKVAEALSVQIAVIDRALKAGAYPKATRIEVLCQVNGLVALRDRLDKRCTPAIERLRMEARAPVQEQSDAG